MKGVSETKLAFEQLAECLDAALVRDWTEQERIAMEQHGDHLRSMKLYPQNVSDV